MEQEDNYCGKREMTGPTRKKWNQLVLVHGREERPEDGVDFLRCVVFRIIRFFYVKRKTTPEREEKWASPRPYKGGFCDP